ncbi:hypothetical protein DSO57_1017159 [Entomophthora muscae]|uniref:Uncharacterized protein n=1 Tax=Entomophthora muscae TaxID=34485 RepID=A0ACC2RVR3_9FUNG|nr:hypothetical protein DSO57_1017159 [Entomophthora muscae]
MKKLFFKVNNRTKVNVVKPMFLEGIQVQNANGHFVLVSSLWKSKTVLLKVLRRFGCPLCRYESRLLSELKPEFEFLGIRLVAIGFERVGLEDFIAGGFWEWELFIDTERSIYTALNLHKVSVSTGLRNMVSASTLAATAAAHRAGIFGDLRGDDFQLGGTFVVERATGKLLYEYRQKFAASYASIRDIYALCGGDPDEVEEKAPLECLVYRSMRDLDKKCFLD